MQCESGNGLTEDGKGLCLRDATHRVQMTFTERGEPQTFEYVMCRGCASHWSIVSPKTVKIIGELELVKQ
jgi:hypothetical protein